jgi:hypothetical protein
VSKEVVSAAKELTKKQISDFLKVKKGAPDTAPSNMRMEPSMVEYEDIDPTEYEDITLEDLYKFQILMELYDMQNNSRYKNYIKL